VPVGLEDRHRVSDSCLADRPRVDPVTYLYMLQLGMDPGGRAPSLDAMNHARKEEPLDPVGAVEARPMVAYLDQPRPHLLWGRAANLCRRAGANHVAFFTDSATPRVGRVLPTGDVAYFDVAGSNGESRRPEFWDARWHAAERHYFRAIRRRGNVRPRRSRRPLSRASTHRRPTTASGYVTRNRSRAAS
jgi:hypothetical protein